VFENRVLKRIFGRNREEVTGDWRRLRVEELHKVKDEMGKECSTRAGDAKHKFLIGKHDGTILLGRPGLGWEDNIKIVLKEI
jgi:hypothetical protein